MTSRRPSRGRWRRARWRVGPAKKSGGARGDASAAVALARSIVADASRVTAFDGALVREISQNGNTFGLNAITTCHRVCAALLAALDAPAEFAACVSADLNFIETDQKTSSAEKNAAGLALWCSNRGIVPAGRGGGALRGGDQRHALADGLAGGRAGGFFPREG